MVIDGKLVHSKKYFYSLLSENINEQDISQKGREALEWCSLSNPKKVIQLIEEKYTVVHMVLHIAPFGMYTRLLKEHLLKQRDKGEAVFITDTDGQHYFFFIGTIVRRHDLLDNVSV